jgi:hypothetical protein
MGDWEVEAEEHEMFGDEARCDAESYFYFTLHEFENVLKQFGAYEVVKALSKEAQEKLANELLVPF